MNSSPEKELLDSVDIIAKGYYDKTMQNYDGLVIAAVSTDIYTIKVNGQTYNLKRYGEATPVVNATVKVFVPRNNWAQAYFIVCGGGGGTGTTDYNSLENKPSINSVTLVGNKTSADLSLYGTSNPPPYPVTSVNGLTGAVTIAVPTKTSDLTNDSGFITSAQAPVQSVNTKTGAVVLTQDDIGNGTTYVQTENNFTDADVTKLSGIVSGAQVNVIESVQQNGTALPITSKTVNVTVPTKTSDITNDSGYITSAQAPVQSVNGLTGAVNLTTDTVPATATNRYVPAVPTANPSVTFLNGNGVFTTIAVGGATSVANVFLSNTDSTVSGYKTLSYDADATSTEMSVTCTSATDVLSATYLYTAPLGVTSIDAGIWKSTFYMKCSANAGTNRLKFTCFVRHADNTETDLFTNYTPSVAQTSYGYFYTETNRTTFTVLATDRLGFRIYGNTSRTSSTTIYYQIGGTNASYFNTPLALRHSQLRDLNGDTSYQHVTTAQVAQIATNTTDITTLQSTKLDKTGDGSNVTATFTEATTSDNITSGSTLSTLFGAIQKAISNLISHIANVSNPHSVTKTQVGLGNVANVLQYSASNPPPYPVTSVNGATGDITIAIPAKTSELTNDSNYLSVIQTSPTNGQIVTFNGTNWVNQDAQTFSQQQANWTETSTSSVQYIQNKPNLSLYAPLASPALTGIPTAPTAITGTSTTQIATTAFVQNAVSSISSGNVTYLSSSQPTSANSGDIWYQIL